MIVNYILAGLLGWVYYSYIVFAKDKYGVDFEKTLLIFIISNFFVISFCLGDILKELKAIRKDRKP